MSSTLRSSESQRGLPSSNTKTASTGDSSIERQRREMDKEYLYTLMGEYMKVSGQTISEMVEDTRSSPMATYTMDSTRRVEPMVRVSISGRMVRSMMENGMWE